MDGIDAVILKTGASAQVIASSLTPYSPQLKARLNQLVTQGQGSLDELGELSVAVGVEFAAAANALLAQANLSSRAITAIGSHGQTVRHGANRALPFSLQIGDPNTIAERTGITTVADFRGRDLAAGGQGAPLLPAFHQCVLSSPNETRAVLNLGGIANITLLHRDGSVLGFDTGPANCLMDLWYAEHGLGTHDPGGQWAATGQIDATLLARLRSEPYFAQPAPKSTGRELFDRGWLAAHAGDALEHRNAADIQATLAELTAMTVADQLPSGIDRPSHLLCCGGGVHNRHLMQRLQHHLPDLSVESTAMFGLDPDFIEAAGFAWLASRTIDGLSGNLPQVTGARGARRLGAIYPAQ